MEEYVDERFKGLAKMENKYVGERSSHRMEIFGMLYRQEFIDLGNDSGKKVIDHIFTELGKYMKNKHIPPNQRQVNDMLKNSKNQKRVKP